jgi:hypothetical protein
MENKYSCHSSTVLGGFLIGTFPSPVSKNLLKTYIPKKVKVRGHLLVS